MTQPTFSTCDLCDAHEADQSGAFRVLAPGYQSFGGIPRFFGPAVVMRALEDNTKVRELLATPGGGRVLVIDGGGSMRRAMVGGNLAVNGAKNGWAGILVHGCVRDVDELRAAQIGIRALGTNPMRTAKLGTGEVDVAVQICGIWVRPGDWVYADDDGVVISDRALTA